MKINDGSITCLISKLSSLFEKAHLSFGEALVWWLEPFQLNTRLMKNSRKTICTDVVFIREAYLMSCTDRLRYVGKMKSPTIQLRSSCQVFVPANSQCCLRIVTLTPTETVSWIKGNCLARNYTNPDFYPIVLEQNFANITSGKLQNLTNSVNFWSIFLKICSLRYVRVKHIR